ncbi:fungal-specific transcription factor domain-containing protein [Plectosphaerella plurivora]|uniref:Fungal-specific transcription factor domain-containing protein n=1 Tax=Plectosphaerella plurivora TaxID=936078 RepID=A0A9P9AAK3_9PEZI|nr:fungal-specific transcription factor domain-containing protein [Plectosphaerella plurivora]
MPDESSGIPDGSPSSRPSPPEASDDLARRRQIRARRRGLKRSSAACERCRTRKQKCDGKLPVCGPCDAVGAVCVPSDRLVIRPETDCQCDELRARVRELERQNGCLRAQLQSIPRPQSTNELALDGGQRDGQVTVPSLSGASRMLLPTFPRLPASELGESGFLSSPWRLWDGLGVTSTPEASEPDFTTASLTEEEKMELVDIFFVKRWPQYPVLHRPTFMEWYHQAAGDLRTFYVNIVLAIGALEKKRSTSSGQAIHQSLFRLAVTKLNHILAANDRDCVQGLLLLSMYGSYEPQAVDIWHTTGLALRLAVGMNMHRRESLGRRGLLHDEMTKRLFWSIYAMDRSICIAMGRPLGIQDADLTMPLPLCLTDEALLAQYEVQALPVPPSLTSNPRDMSTFLHIVQLRRLNAGIYCLKAQSLESTRARYYVELNQWLVSAPRYMNPACMNQTSEWFHIAYHQAVMNLYRPSYTSLPNSTVSPDAISLCADSAISLIINYSSLHAKNRITYSFVALTSLFMAAVTMLYSIRASPALRKDLTKAVIQSNINICCSLLRAIASGRAEGERSASILQRLGTATLAIFDSGVDVEGGIDTEFLSWFGLKSQHGDLSHNTPSVDMAWNDLFDSGFDFGGLFCNDMLL